MELKSKDLQGILRLLYIAVKVYIKVSKSRDKTAIQRMDALSRRNPESHCKIKAFGGVYSL